MNLNGFLRVDMQMKLDFQRWIWAVLLGLVVANASAALVPSEAPGLAQADLRRDATVRAVEIAQPGVVSIATATIKQYGDYYDPIFRQFYGQIRQREELSSIGSGIIIDEDGYVLTAFHVLQRATRAQVKLSNGEVYDVELKVYAYPNLDVALLKIHKKKPDEKFQAIKFAADDDLLLGETVIAMGNPFGLGGSVSRGILSSKNRRPFVEDEPLNIPDLLQTDAAINPGNSGGPLINMHGELIGMNNAKGNGPGIGFALPVRQISIALSEALSPERTDSLWFGARVKLNESPLVITAIQTGSPADKAGLRVGQQILQVDGKAPKNLIDFNDLIAAAKDREPALQVRQGLETSTKNVKLVPFLDVVRDRLGLSLLKMTPETAASFGISVNDGFIVGNVEKNSPVALAKLSPGTLVTAIDGQNAGNLVNIGTTLIEKKPGDTVQLTVMQRRQSGNTVQLQRTNVSVQLR